MSALVLKDLDWGRLIVSDTEAGVEFVAYDIKTGKAARVYIHKSRVNDIKDLANFLCVQYDRLTTPEDK